MRALNKYQNAEGASDEQKLLGKERMRRLIWTEE